MSCRMGLRLTLMIGLAATLSACGNMEGVKKQLGMTKQSPDEFRVVSRAPLTLPPDFALRPPAPGAPRPQEGTTADQARRAVFRMEEPEAPKIEVADTTDTRSIGERSLLKAAGADRAEPKIRLIVDRETNRLNAESDAFIEQLIFWRDKEKPGVVVDAQGEAKRLQENAALGKDVTAGQTPTIERRQKGILEGVF